jgi:hypothetical protein
MAAYGWRGRGIKMFTVTRSTGSCIMEWQCLLEPLATPVELNQRLGPPEVFLYARRLVFANRIPFARSEHSLSRTGSYNHFKE